MDRGDTFHDSDGQLVVLDRIDDLLQVAERYSSDQVHWHKFWMNLEEVIEFERGDKLSEENLETIEELVSTHPKRTPSLEKCLLS